MSASRNNPEWWLSLEADSGVALRRGNKDGSRAALSIVIVAIPLAAFMPWSGTAEAERYSGEPTPIISPSPLLTLAPEPEEQEYIPDAAEVEALAKMLYGEARGSLRIWKKPRAFGVY